VQESLAKARDKEPYSKKGVESTE
jgi:Transposase DDE domain